MRQTQITLALLSLSLTLTLPGASVASEAAAASGSREAAAYSAFEKALGAEAVNLLDSLDHIVVTEVAPQDRRLLHVQWQALEPVAAHAEDLVALADLYLAARSGDNVPSLDFKPLRTVQSLQAGGLVSPAVKAAADVLALHLAALTSVGPASAASKDGLLFDESWARSFIERVHGGLLDDFRAFAPEYFSLFLTAPDSGVESIRHFLAHTQTVYSEDLSKTLEEDRAAGKSSDRVEAAVASYLLDQKRLWTLSQTRPRLKALERSTELRREFQHLRTIAERLKAPEVLPELRRAFEAPAAEAKTLFNGPELHVRPAGGARDFKVGDKVLVSAVYYVEGLGPEEKTPVNEIGFVAPGGAVVAHRSQKTVRRGNGGFYTYSSEWTLDTDQPVVYRFVVGSPAGAVFSREARIEPLQGEQASESALEEADSLAQECRFEEAGRSLKILADSLASDPTAGRRSETALAAHSATMQAQVGLLLELEQALPGARLHASPEQCQYSAAKAEYALSLLRRLPPGCDRSPLSPGGILSEELRGLAETASRRKLAQEAFRFGVAAARRLEDSCRFEEAARRYASALALLDADPGARCGEWEQEHSRIRIEDLPRAIKASGRAGSIDRTLEAASRKFSEADYAAALDTAVPVLAAVSSMPSGSCYSSQKEKASKLIEAAGVALGPAPAESLQSTLLPDTASKESADVKAEHEARLRRQAHRQHAQEVRQAPLAPGRDSTMTGGGQ